MLYLVTGANGAGKTLNTLKWVREISVKESRPVCHNGRFKPVDGGELSTWKCIDFKDWQKEPDGTIFVIDECHNDLPVRPAGSKPPDYVGMLAEHRRRGFDFYLITQHPQNVDAFVRRLIGSPGWHRHVRRTFGASVVSVLEWPAVNPNCEKEGAARNAEVSIVPFPKEVFSWYESASIHTGKRKIPKKVWVLLGSLLGAIALIWYVFAIFAAKAKPAATAPAATGSPGVDVAASPRSGSSSAPMSRAEYLDARVARLPDFPHTAPAYDEVTKPVRAPYPAACITMRGDCRCYTQQGTLLQTSADTCMRIVTHGFFVDWEEGDGKGKDKKEGEERQQQREPLMAQDHGGKESTMPLPDAWKAELQDRNARVRSIL